LDCESKIGLRCHNCVGFGAYCGVDSNRVEVNAKIAMNLAKPHPSTVGDSVSAFLPLRWCCPDGEVTVSLVGQADANRAPVTERSIKNPHRGGDNDY